MKKTVLSLIVFFLTLSVFAQSIERLKKENGFQEFKFDTKPSDYENVTFIESIDNTKVYYCCTNNVREAFGLPCSRIDLSFYKEKLYFINIHYTDGGVKIYNMLKEELEKSYGPSKKMFVKIAGEIEYDSWRYEDFNLIIKYFNNGLVDVNYMKNTF